MAISLVWSSCSVYSATDSKQAENNKSETSNAPIEISGEYPLMNNPPYSINTSYVLYPVQDKESQLYGYIDGTGKLVITAQYKFAEPFVEGVACVGNVLDEEMLINTENDTLLLLSPEVSFDSYTDGMIQVSILRIRWIRYVNWNVDFISDLFQVSYGFSDRLSLTSTNDEKYGYINKSMVWVIPEMYEQASSFSEGLACVKQGENFGYIDQSNSWIISPQFNSDSAFCLGYASVEIGKNGVL